MAGKSAPGGCLIIVILFAAVVWWFAIGAEQAQWRTFVRDNNCKLVSKTESKVIPLSKTVEMPNGQKHVKNEMGRYPGREVWECDGPEDEPDYYERWDN